MEREQGTYVERTGLLVERGHLTSQEMPSDAKPKVCSGFLKASAACRGHPDKQELHGKGP